MRAHMHACVKIHIYCRHLNVHIFHWLQMWRKTTLKKTHFAHFVLCPPPETRAHAHTQTHARAHFLAYTVDLQVVLSVTNGVVCLLSCYFPAVLERAERHPLELIMTSPLALVLCMCVHVRVCTCVYVCVCAGVCGILQGTAVRSEREQELHPSDCAELVRVY